MIPRPNILIRRLNAHPKETMGTTGEYTGASTTHGDWLAPATFSNGQRTQEAF
jgi:hypothetical protein